MINRLILQRVQKQFEADPNLLGNDLKFSEIFTIARLLDDIDTSIEALGKMIKKGGMPAYYQNLQQACSTSTRNGLLWKNINLTQRTKNEQVHS